MMWPFQRKSETQEIEFLVARKRSISCPVCGGEGWDADWGGPYTCGRCKGTGKLPRCVVPSCWNSTDERAMVRGPGEIDRPFVSHTLCQKHREDPSDIQDLAGILARAALEIESGDQAQAAAVLREAVENISATSASA